MFDLQHPNVLRLLAIASNPPYTYIVTEYCKYGSLEDFLKNRTDKIGLNQKLNLALGVAKGMHYLHSKNIAHCDLKLSNLLVAEGRVVKVGDLGTATNAMTLMTRVGTIDYTAPEVLEGKPYTKSCDVYSFGICLWAMFSGIPLYPNWTMYEILKNVVPGARPDIAAITSPKLAKLIQACWFGTPDDRFSFDQVIIELSNISQGDFEPKVLIKQFRCDTGPPYGPWIAPMVDAMTV